MEKLLGRQAAPRGVGEDWEVGKGAPRVTERRMESCLYCLISLSFVRQFYPYFKVFDV